MKKLKNELNGIKKENLIGLDIVMDAKIRKILELIINKFEGHKFEVYLYGSCTGKLRKIDALADIDVAVVFDTNVEMLRGLSEESQQIRLEVLKNENVLLSVFIEEKSKFYEYSEPYYEVIKNGLLVYKNYANCICGSDKKYNIELNIIDKVRSSIESSKINLNYNCYNQSIVQAYYSYYHGMALLLIKKRINWKSETEVLLKFFNEYVRNGVYFSEYDIQNCLKCEHYKDIALFNYNKNLEIDVEVAKNILQKAEQFVEKVFNICKC